MMMLTAMAMAMAMACSAPAPAPVEVKKVHPEPTREKPVMTGALTRAQLTDIPRWNEPVPVDVAAAQALAGVQPGAHVLAVIGTWCSDSRREVPRLLQAIDAAGGSMPFTLEMVGVDRDKKSPGLTVDVAYVPTFIVTRRDGAPDGSAAREVGRIVESAPNGIEKDLLSLLDGTKSGIITARHDLAK